MISKKFIYLIFFSFFICGAHFLVAQSLQSTLSMLFYEDSTDINTIALYPKSIRDDLFKVSTHSEGIVKLNVIQKKSKEAFRKKLENLPKEVQKKVWNISRFENLIPQLLEMDDNNNLETVLSKYPKAIHDDAVSVFVNNRDILPYLDHIYQDFETSFSIIISVYNSEDQLAFRHLMKTPELVGLLLDNLNLAVSLGDIYKTDSTLLHHQFDSLQTLLAQHQLKEKEEWKEEMTNNPEAQKEFIESTQEFDKELSYTAEELKETDQASSPSFDDLPYSYWSGHPWWLEPDYWYPYPYWYHYGFYYRQHRIIWIGIPSWHFIRWHFHHHFNYNFYPHFTNLLIEHYYFGPRRPASRHKVPIGNWIEQNRELLPDKFNSNRELRINSIRELGKAEIDRERYNRENPGNPVSSFDFVRQHHANYPDLKHEKDQKPALKNTRNPEKGQPSGGINKTPEKNKLPIQGNHPQRRTSEDKQKSIPKTNKPAPDYHKKDGQSIRTESRKPSANQSTPKPSNPKSPDSKKE